MSPTMATKIETLKVPGANLYYEVRGSGPVLLMMPGGPADASAFRSIVGHLATHYTVVTYDPRGLSRTKLRARSMRSGSSRFSRTTSTACWPRSPRRRPTFTPAAAAL